MRFGISSAGKLPQVNGPQKRLVLRVFLPRGLVIHDGRHPVNTDEPSDCFAEAAVDLRALLVEDADAQIDEGEGVFDELYAIDDSSRGLCLDLFEGILGVVSVKC